MLGYPRVVSLDNFRSPNFTLVAEVLRWLARRVASPDAVDSIPLATDSEADRVLFVKAVAQLLVGGGTDRQGTLYFISIISSFIYFIRTTVLIFKHFIYLCLFLFLFRGAGKTGGVLFTPGGG